MRTLRVVLWWQLEQLSGWLWERYARGRVSYWLVCAAGVLLPAAQTSLPNGAEGHFPCPTSRPASFGFNLFDIAVVPLLSQFRSDLPGFRGVFPESISTVLRVLAPLWANYVAGKALSVGAVNVVAGHQ